LSMLFLKAQKKLISALVSSLFKCFHLLFFK
jgi:hypothetical protein